MFTEEGALKLLIVSLVIYLGAIAYLVFLGYGGHQEQGFAPLNAAGMQEELDYSVASH